MEILTPFEEATGFVQVGCVPSAGYVCLVMHSWITSPHGE